MRRDVNLKRFNNFGFPVHPFENFFSLLNNSLGAFEGTARVPVDIYETKDNVVVKADMPGFKKEDVRVEVEGNTLYLKAEKSEEVESVGKNQKYYRREREAMQFRQAAELPGAVLFHCLFNFTVLAFVISKISANNTCQGVLTRWQN